MWFRYTERSESGLPCSPCLADLQRGMVGHEMRGPIVMVLQKLIKEYCCIQGTQNCNGAEPVPERPLSQRKIKRHAWAQVHHAVPIAHGQRKIPLFDAEMYLLRITAANGTSSTKRMVKL
jgi:hypothetical protein